MTPVPLTVAKALLLFAFAAAMGTAGASDLSMRSQGPIGVPSDADSAVLADLPLETLLQVSVVPAAPAIGQDSARPSEVYALHYVVPGVAQGIPLEQVRQEHLAMHGMRLQVREF